VVDAVGQEHGQDRALGEGGDDLFLGGGRVDHQVLLRLPLDPHVEERARSVRGFMVREW
jgi:hypothetical protein